MEGHRVCFHRQGPESCSALSSAESADDATVKGALLKVHQVVPEACRQRFHNWEKGDI